MNEYKLTEAERGLLVELEADAHRAAAAALAPFNAKSDAICTLIYRQQGLTGNWRLNEDKTALLKMDG